MSSKIDQHHQELIKLRRRLHSIPEVSGSEKQTAGVITDFLKDTSPETLETGVGGEGILATYEGASEGPHILLRCELDALPITDENELDYRSQNEGRGHKCGHDGHMSILCGVAKLLQDQRPPSGKVTLLFQPAEETGEGASRILEDEKFKKVNPDYCFALHNLPGYNKHQIILKEDVFAAASVGLTVTLQGETAHAAHPEQGMSPALALAQLIQGLSALPQFKTAIDDSAKVTVVNAGLGEKAFGTSPGKGSVSATLRTYRDETLEQLQEECLRLAGGAADTYGLNYTCEWVEAFPATVNHQNSVRVIQTAANSLNLKVEVKEHPFGWSEDFGHMLQQFPGALFGLGAGKDQPALHAANYDFPDEIITTGVSMFMQIIKEVTSA